MVNYDNTKAEIIAEMKKIGAAVRGYDQYTRHLNSLNKNDLMELYHKMLDAIIATKIDRILNGQEPGNETYKPYVDEYNRKTNLLMEARRATTLKFKERVAAMVDADLGNDLVLDITSYRVTMGIPSTDDKRRSNLTIDLYYRENLGWGEDGCAKIHSGRMEVNQPTWGSWDPLAPENSYIRRFFEVLNDICKRPQFVTKLAGLFDEEYQSRWAFDKDMNKEKKMAKESLWPIVQKEVESTRW